MSALVSGANIITTLGPATYTVPAGTWDIAYTLIGGGGGGGGANKAQVGVSINYGYGTGSGGGGGQTKTGTLAHVSGNTTINTNVGIGGTGSIAMNLHSEPVPTATNGGDTSISVDGITYTANKGLAGETWNFSTHLLSTPPKTAPGGVSGSGVDTLADGQNGGLGYGGNSLGQFILYYPSKSLNGGVGGGTNGLNNSGSPGVGGAGGNVVSDNNVTGGNPGNPGIIILTLSLSLPPSVPENLLITSSDKNLSFTFNASASGNPTSYTATIAKNANRSEILETKTVSPSTTESFSNLINGEVYIITVSATNSGGSVSSDANHVPNGPPLPAIITSMNNATDNTLTVNFTPSTSPTPSYVRDYTVSLTAPGQTVVPQTVTSSLATFTELVAGVTYTAIVTANYGLENTVTSASLSKVVLGNALPVTITSAEAGNEEITVNFNASATLYSELNDYLITLTPTTGDPKTFSVPATNASSFSKICTGLEKFMEYTVKVETQGKGTPINSTLVISTNTPKATTLNVISPSIASPLTVGDGTLEVNFTPAAQDAGITVTGYTVSLSPGNATAQAIDLNGPYKANFTGLTNGVTYTATVTVNAISGSASATATGIPNGPPAAPSFNVYIPTNPLTAEGNSNELKIDYSFSASGSPYVTSYDIILTPVGGTAFDDINVANTIQSVLINPTTQPLIKLIAGQAYSIIVRANSANGSTSSLPKEATPTGSAEPATITSVVADNKKITVHFSASATPSEHLESYIVVLTPTEGSNLRSDPIPVTSASTYSYTFEGLTNYLEHTAKVIAKGNADVVNGTEINSTTLIASPTGPDAPTLVRAEASTGPNTIPASGNAVVSFTHPIVPAGGSLIEGYTVTASPGGTTATGSASPLTVSGLTNGNEYTFTVTAKNALQNVSEPSVSSLGVTPTSVPDAPTLVSAVAGDHTVTITFTAPTNTGGANVSSYSVFCDDNLSERSEPASSSPFVYSGLENGKEYTFSVCANNYNGSSGSSNSLKATPASLAILEMLNVNVNVIPNIATFMRSVVALNIEDGGLVRFADLGVNLSVLNTNDHKKRITKTLINSVFEEKTELNNFMVEKSSFPIVSSNAKDNILVVKANEPFEITKLESTTSIYVAIETVGDSNTFIIGADEFTIAKTSLGYNFIYNNTTTSHIDGGEERVGDLLIVFGGCSVSFDPLNNSTPHCYARGTLIGTSRGWVPIEDLLMSDKLRSYDLIKESMFKPVGGVPFKALVRVEDTRFKNRFAGIKFIGKFTVNSMNKNTAPIRITAGALGENKPERDLLVSPNHSMLISNRLIFAKFLVNGSTIYQDMSFNKIDYFHVLSDDHYIISANGALSETLGTEEFKLFETMIYAQSQIYQPLASENKYSFTEMAI